MAATKVKGFSSSFKLHGANKMKLFVLLLLTGYASSTLLDDFKRETHGLVSEFLVGLEDGKPLHEALGIENTEEAQRLERDLKEELKKHIKDAFKRVLERVNEEVTKGKEINKEALDILKDLHEKMNELQITDEELEEGIDQMKEKINNKLQEILKKMKILDKRSTDPDSVENIVGDLNLRTLLIKLKELIVKKMDPEVVRKSLAKVIGQATQKLCEWLTDKGKQKVLNFFDRLLDDDDIYKRKRAEDDRMQEIKDYLENIEEDVKNKLKLFRDWLNDLIKTGLTKSENKIEKAREILKKIISQSKDMSKKGLSTVLDYLKKYEKEFGMYFGDIRVIIQGLLKEKN